MRKSADLFLFQLMLLLCAIWGSQQVAIKLAAPDVAPMLQVALRSGIAAVLVGLLLLSACGDSDVQEVRTWMKQVDAQTQVRVPPLAEPKTFIPFAYAEAAANRLTHPALDPAAKIAEVKYCAVAIEAVVGAVVAEA